MTPWLHIIGIGEDGWDGLTPAAQAALQTAQVIIGGERHHGLADDLPAQRLTWPSPFRAMIPELQARRGQRVAVLVTGDPLWYSAGALIGRQIDPSEIAYHPQLSAFQWAAARMGWSLADVDTVTVHGRPVEQLIPFLAPGKRLLVLTQDENTPSQIAKLLHSCELGDSRLTVLGALGGVRETRRDGVVTNPWEDMPAFHTLAINCAGTRRFPRWGLPDDAFSHDGKMTKRELRVLTLAALAPRRGERLWDIGTGCGSVAVEWLRADRDMEAVGIDPSPAHLSMAATNATRLGAPRLRLIEGRAPDALADLPAPDAVFIGGGLNRDVACVAMQALPPMGRLVANAVTLETETILTALHTEFGGDLARIQVSRAQPVGRYRGWRAHMPVTQWSWTK
jgi:precorrin-6Y C5,15-methyltransferase (decarboxylating)